MLDRPTVRGTTVADRREFDVNAKAIRHFPSTIYPHLCDWHGHALADVRRLGDPTYDGSPNGRRSNDVWPKAVGLRGPNSWDGGSWLCFGPPSASGKDVIALVEFLGQCDRKTAAEWLGDLVDRIREVA